MRKGMPFPMHEKQKRGDFRLPSRQALLLAYVDVNGRAREVPLLAHLVLQEAAVRLLDVLRQVGEEHERGYARVGQLRDILYLDVLALGGWWRICLDERQHLLVETGRRDAGHTVVVHLLGRFEHLQDALLGEGRGEDNGEVDERGEAVPDGVLEGFHHLHGLLLHQIPLVYHHHQPLGVALYQGEDVEVLPLHAARGVQHQDADVGVLDGADGAHHGVVLQVLVDLILLAYTSRVYQIEVEAELVVTSIDGVARGAGNVGHDVTLLADECIHDGRLAHVGPSHHGKAGHLVLYRLGGLFAELADEQVQEVARAAA